MNNFLKSTSPSLPTGQHLFQQSQQSQQQQQQQSNQGRSRSGTLPTSFITTTRNQLTPNGHNLSTSTSNNTLANPLTSSPLYHTEPQISSHNVGSNQDFLLTVPTSKDSAISTSPLHNSFMSNTSMATANGNNINLNLNVDGNLSTTPTRRMRSGSLFSTNSIWNDDNNSSNSNHSLHSEFVISPSLDASSPSHQQQYLQQHQHQQQQQQQQRRQLQYQQSSLRNRSYTTNAAIPSVTINATAESFNNHSNPTHNGSYYRNGGLNKVSTSPFISIGGKTNDNNSLIDNFMLNGEDASANAPRIRSQTYSGSTPPGVNEQIFNTNSTAAISGAHLGARLQLNPQPDILQAQLNNNSFPGENFDFTTKQDIKPDLIDDFDFSQLMITTNFENTNLGPTRFLLFDNLPLYIDSCKLFMILVNSNNHKSFGSVVSVKMTITTTSKLALVECTNIETAMNLKANFNHLEISPGNTLYVAFAKVEEPRMMDVYDSPVKSIAELNLNNSTQAKSLRGQSNSPQSVLSKHGSISSAEMNGNASHHATTSTRFTASTTATAANTSNIIEVITKLSSSVNLSNIRSIVNKCIAYPNENYRSDFGPLPDPIPSRQFDSPTLRELRKVLENKEAGLFDQIGDSNFSQVSVDELALAMLDELPEICYDYLGNTIVQKLFTLLDDENEDVHGGGSLVKLMMVKEIAPYLTQLSIHKNGTWAIQKIINLCCGCSSSLQQMYLIGASLKPYAVKLFNDQFGNYVIQGCIKFGSPFNDFVFEAMLDNFLEISFGRYGARCIRTILEGCNNNNQHHHETNGIKAEGTVSHEQVLLAAGLIIEFANELVVNSNGSLLITWYLDTFDSHNGTKINLLVDKFLPNLPNLCVHRLANLTILKILNHNTATTTTTTTTTTNHSNDGDVKHVLIDAIFANIDNLKFILQERSDDNNSNAGPLFIYKVLSNPILAELTSGYLPAIKRILMEINIINFHNYKKLMDEVGLSSSRSGKSFSSKRGGGSGGATSGATGGGAGVGGSSGAHNLNHNHSHHGNGRRGQRNGNGGASKYDSYQNHHHHQQHQHQHQLQNHQQQPPSTGNFHSQPPHIQQQFSMQHIPPPQSYQYVPLVQPQQHQYATQQPSAYMKQYYAQQAMAQAQAQAQAQQQYYPPPPPPPQQRQRGGLLPSQQPLPQELAVMQQLEQLSLSSAALGYNSNPSTPTVQQRNLYM